MALTKIKVNEVDTKATPVLSDSVLISDSEDDGRGKLVTGTAFEEMIATGDTLTTALAAKAPLASPALTGTPTAPTAAAGTNTQQIATTAFCGNYNQKWTYSYSGIGGAINAVAWTMHGFGASATLTIPLASSVASGVQVSAIVVQGLTEVVLTRSGSDQFVTPTGLATTYTLRGNGSSIVLVRVTASAWACVGAPDSLINAAIAPLAPLASPALTGTPTAPTAEKGTNTTQLATTAFVQAATASSIYDLPVTRWGVVSSGTDVVLFETGVLDPAWYDTTHVLNVSFFARNDSGVTYNTTFKLQLYDEGTSTAHTIGSIYADTLDFDLLQASIYRTSSSGLNCNIQYYGVSKSGYVTLASGSYKLRVVCTSTLDTRFGAAQVRFTK